MLPDLLRGHQSSGRADDVEAALEVDADDAIEFVFGVVEELLADVDAGRADQPVEATAVRRANASSTWSVASASTMSSDSCSAVPPVVANRVPPPRAASR